MISPDQFRDSAKLAMATFLLIDSQVALAFIQLAQHTYDLEARARRMDIARRAYHKIVDLLPQTQMSAEQRSLLSRRLSVLHSHFAKAGSELA